MKLKKSIKFITALILVCASVIPAFSVFASANNHACFTDVKTNSWYYNAVNYCQVQGYINGVGNNMTARDAADFAYEIDAKCAIPLHYGLYDDVDPEDFDFDDKLVLTPYEAVEV